MISEGNSDYNSPISEARTPSLLALRCFESAGRFENFARAAEELHLTPGAISRAVRLLEEDLGVDLFERRSRRVFLTDAGRRLAKAVSEGLGVMSQAVRGIRRDSRRARQLVLSCERNGVVAVVDPSLERLPNTSSRARHSFSGRRRQLFVRPWHRFGHSAGRFSSSPWLSCAEPVPRKGRPCMPARYGRSMVQQKQEMSAFHGPTASDDQPTYGFAGVGLCKRAAHAFHGSANF